MPLKRFILAWCGRKLLTALVYSEFNVLIITGESQFVLVSDSTENYQAIPLRCKGCRRRTGGGLRWKRCYSIRLEQRERDH